MGLMVMARCPDASSTLPCRGEGRTAEGSPGWGDGVTTYAENVEALSPPPGPLARADLPPPGGGDRHRRFACDSPPLQVGEGGVIPITTFAGKKVAVFGLGGSGMVAASALSAGGADVVGWDDSLDRIAAAAGM